MHVNLTQLEKFCQSHGHQHRIVTKTRGDFYMTQNFVEEFGLYSNLFHRKDNRNVEAITKIVEIAALFLSFPYLSPFLCSMATDNSGYISSLDFIDLFETFLDP